jgi:hypothetical protein
VSSPVLLRSPTKVNRDPSFPRFPGLECLWGAKTRCADEKLAIYRQDANFGTQHGHGRCLHEVRRQREPTRRDVTEWQTEGSHRRNLERSALRGSCVHSREGNSSRSRSRSSSSGGGLALSFTDRKTGGLVAVIAPMATLAGVFVYNLRRSGPQRNGEEGALDGTEHVQRAAGMRQRRT